MRKKDWTFNPELGKGPRPYEGEEKKERKEKGKRDPVHHKAPTRTENPSLKVDGFKKRERKKVLEKPSRASKAPSHRAWEGGGEKGEKKRGNHLQELIAFRAGEKKRTSVQALRAGKKKGGGGGGGGTPSLIDKRHPRRWGQDSFGRGGGTFFHHRRGMTHPLPGPGGGQRKGERKIHICCWPPGGPIPVGNKKGGKGPFSLLPDRWGGWDFFRHRGKRVG